MVKKLSIKRGIVPIIFALIMALAFVTLHPLYKRTMGALRAQVQSVCKMLEDKYGIIVSYGQLSPAILTFLNIKDITIKEAAHGQVILHIKNITLRYSILRLIAKDFENGLNDLTLDGIDVNINDQNLAYFRDTWGLLRDKTAPPPPASTTLDEGDFEAPEKKRTFGFAELQKIIDTLPLDVNIRHVKFLYTGVDSNKKPLAVEAYMRRLNLDFVDTGAQTNRLDPKTQLKLSTNGTLRALIGGKNLSTSYSLTSTLFDDLDGSTTNFHLSNITDGEYYFNRLNLQASFLNNRVTLKTIENAYPFHILALFDTRRNVLDASVKTDGLTLGNVVSAKSVSPILKTLKAINLTSNTQASFNLNTKRLDYSSRGTVISDHIALDDLITTKFDVVGNDKKITINNIDISSSVLNAQSTVSLIFEGLRLNGSANLYNFTLPNGGNISTEVYFDAQKNGFLAFAPQLMMDEKAFTALQLQVRQSRDSLDFSFEMNDYAHPEETPGLIKIDGSYLLREKFLQASLNMNNIFLDSVANTASFFTKQKNTPDLVANPFAILSPWVFNSEVYVSSNLGSMDLTKGLEGLPAVSFNMPYTIVANTRRDNQAIYLSLDGSNTSVQISTLDIAMGSFMTQLSGIVEKVPLKDEAFVMLDTNFNNIPYHVLGNVTPKSLSLQGDYGLALEAHSWGGSFATAGATYDGSFCMDDLPIALGQSIMYLTLDSGFSYSKENGLDASVARFSAQGTGGRYPFSPKLVIAGATVSKYGAFINNLTYSDIFSNLTGSSELLWNVNDGIFDSAQFNFTALDTNGTKLDKDKENLTISIDISNPDKVPLSLSFLQHSMYFNSQFSAQNFELNRFTRDTSNKNSITAQIIASGTLDNPYVGINIDDFSYTSGKKHLSASLSAFLEEKVFTIDRSFLRFNRFSFTNIAAKFDLTTLSGKLTTDFDTYFLRKTLHVPLELSIDNVYKEPGLLIPTEAMVKLSTPEVSGTFIKTPFPFELTALHSGETTSIFTNEEVGLVASITNKGAITASIDETKPLSFNLSGDLGKKALDFHLTNIAADVGNLWAYTNFPYVNVFKGVAKGDLHITGMKKDPDFTGSVLATGIDINVPMVVPSHITVDKAQVLFNHDQINIPQITGYIKGNNQAFAKADVFMNGLSLDHVEALFWTPPKKFVPLDLDVEVARFKGEANARVTLYYQDKYMDISGVVNARKAMGMTSLSQITGIPATIIPFKKKRKLTEIELMPLPYFIRCDMSINLLNRCSFQFDPLLRAVFAPNGSLQFKYDTEDGSMMFDGEVPIRTGDIAWLNRNFYLREGLVKFSPNETKFNPIVTLNARTREKDDKGGDVQIILSANNQYLLELAPQITSIPAKSETEINQILGQVAVADSSNVQSFLLATGDYALQSTIGRTLENKVRDFLKLDILSVRTSLIQNALKINTEDSTVQGRRNIDIDKNNVGNYFDNSTVYVGKYFGSNIYADALMHWSYDDTRINDGMTFNGLVFKPEIGLELESPFMSIRWNMAPDISAMINHKFSMDASVTLSWKWAL